MFAPVPVLLLLLAHEAAPTTIDVIRDQSTLNLDVVQSGSSEKTGLTMDIHSVVSESSSSFDASAALVSDLSTSHTDTTLGGEWRYSQLDLSCLNFNYRNDINIYLQAPHTSHGGLPSYISLDPDDPFSTMETYEVKSATSKGDGKKALKNKGGHWTLKLGDGVSCLPWTDNYHPPDEHNGCLPFTDVSDALHRLHTAIVNEVLRVLYTNEELGAFMNDFEHARKEMVRVIAGDNLDYNTVFPDDHHGRNPALQLYHSNSWRPEFEKYMRQLWTKVFGLWSISVPHLDGTAATNLAAIDHLLKYAKVGIRLGTGDLVRYEIFRWYETLEADKDGSLKTEITNVLHHGLNLGPRDRPHKDLIKATQYLLMCLVRVTLGLDSDNDKLQFVKRTIESFTQKQARDIRRRRMGAAINPTDYYTAVFNAAIHVENAHKAVWYSDLRKALIILRNWMISYHRDGPYTTFIPFVMDPFFDLTHHPNSIQSLTCLPVLHGVVGYNVQGTPTTEARKKNGAGIGFLKNEEKKYERDEEKHREDPRYSFPKLIQDGPPSTRHVQTSCARFAVMQMLDWNKEDGHYDLSVGEGWLNNMIGKLNRDGKVRNKTNANRQLHKDAPMSNRLIAVPSKCVADKALTGTKINANCRMFQWCVRQIVSQLCPADAVQARHSKDIFFAVHNVHAASIINTRIQSRSSIHSNSSLSRSSSIHSIASADSREGD